MLKTEYYGLGKQSKRKRAFVKDLSNVNEAELPIYLLELDSCVNSNGNSRDIGIFKESLNIYFLDLQYPLRRCSHI